MMQLIPEPFERFIYKYIFAGNQLPDASTDVFYLLTGKFPVEKTRELNLKTRKKRAQRKAGKVITDSIKPKTNFFSENN